MPVKIDQKLITSILQEVTDLKNESYRLFHDEKAKALHRSCDNSGWLYGRVAIDPVCRDYDLMDLLLWGDNLHYKKDLPESWFEKIIPKQSGSPSLQLVGVKEASKSIEDGEAMCKKFRQYYEAGQLIPRGEYRVEWVVNPTATPPAHARNVMSNGGYSYQKPTLSYCAPPDWSACNTINLRPFVHPKIDELYNHLVERHEFQLQWFECAAKIVEFLHHCQNLNQAATLFPGLLGFLPAERAEQVKKRPAAKKPAGYSHENAIACAERLKISEVVLEVAKIRMAQAM